MSNGLLYVWRYRHVRLYRLTSRLVHAECLLLSRLIGLANLIS